MISFDNNVGSKEFPLLEPLSSLRHPRPPHRPLTEVFNFSDGDIPGDVFFTGNWPSPTSSSTQIGIEIKSLHDLRGSLDTNRLQGQGEGASHGQLLRMLDYFDVTILIYYGNYWASKSHETGPLIKYSTTSGDELLSKVSNRFRKLSKEYPSDVPKLTRDMLRWIRTLSRPLALGKRRHYWHGLQNALLEINMLGVYVIRVNDKREVATAIVSFYHLLQKPWSSHKLFRGFNTSNPSSPRLSRLATLDKIPPHIIRAAKGICAMCDAIGFERGLAIANHFNGNIPLMINTISSSPSAISEIKTGDSSRRIGPVISGAVHRAIGTGDIDVDDLARMLK